MSVVRRIGGWWGAGFGAVGSAGQVYPMPGLELLSIADNTALEILLNAFCGAALEQHGGRTPSFKNRRILDLLGSSAPNPDGTLYQSFVRMIDFIAGMTDSYATEMAGEMTGRSSPT